MPLVCKRAENGRVRVSLWRDDTCAMQVEITEVEARTLAASLLVAASKEADVAASSFVEGVEIARSGADFISRLHKLAKGARR